MPCQGFAQPPAQATAEGREGSKLPADDGVMLRRAHQTDGSSERKRGQASQARERSPSSFLFRARLS